MNTSENIKDLAAALAKAQGAFKNPSKSSENPHFKSQYADLASGINAIKGQLSANGIAVTQTTYMAGDMMMLETRLIHSSGQWLSSEYPVCRFPARQQEIGSALTFSRRYSLFAVCGIAGEGEDDDGNAATTKVEAPITKQEPLLLDTDSSEVEADDLIAAMEPIVRVEALRSWAATVKSRKDVLQPKDSKRVVTAYRKREKEIMDKAIVEDLKAHL